MPGVSWPGASARNEKPTTAKRAELIRNVRKYDLIALVSGEAIANMLYFP
jgi:hypothetical protein